MTLLLKDSSSMPKIIELNDCIVYLRYLYKLFTAYEANHRDKWILYQAGNKKQSDPGRHDPLFRSCSHHTLWNIRIADPNHTKLIWSGAIHHGRSGSSRPHRYKHSHLGFGLSFSLGKNKIWSSLGFHLLITVITFQLYFLVSAFWTNVGISGSSKTFTWGNKFPAFLTDSNNNSFGTCGITAVQALKCSLANGISFAAISGRAGPLEAMVVSLFGTLIYELNRQLVSRYSFDFGGTITIFCFAGFFGSTISIILYHCVQKQKFKEHRMRLSSNFSTLFAAIGSLFCWVFFPFLNIDLPLSLILSYSAGLNTIFCISACVATTVSLTCIINGKLNFRDIIFSTIAGGVAVGSSAAIINTSLQALLLGVGAGVMHVALF